MSETIAIYLLVFLVLFSFALIIMWALSLTDASAFPSQLCCLAPNHEVSNGLIQQLDSHSNSWT